MNIQETSPVNLWAAAQSIVPANSWTSSEEVAERVASFVQKNQLLAGNMKTLNTYALERYKCQQILKQVRADISQYDDYVVTEDQVKVIWRHLCDECVTLGRSAHFEVWFLQRDHQNGGHLPQMEMTSVEIFLGSVIQPDSDRTYRVFAMNDFRTPDHFRICPLTIPVRTNIGTYKGKTVCIAECGLETFLNMRRYLELQ
jgi:hypothetical protein